MEAVTKGNIPPIVDGVVTLTAPRDPRLAALYDLWKAKRGSRQMPARDDFKPAEFKTLLPNICLLDVVAAPERYRARLMGEEVVKLFEGGNPVGKTVEDVTNPEAAAPLRAVLDSIVDSRAPLFRAGKVYWRTEKSFVDYESANLPLSSDGANVTMLMIALVFIGEHP